MPSSADIKTQVKLRISQEFLNSSIADQQLDLYIENACFDMSGTKFFRELLQTTYGITDADGKFTIPRSVLPYQYYYGGLPYQDYTWLRLTPVGTEEFLRWRSGISRGYRSGGGASYIRRYSIIPTDNSDYTTVQFMESSGIMNVKMIYYPILPDITEFPEYFSRLIIPKVLFQYAMDNKAQTADKFFTMLQNEIKQAEKLVYAVAQTIEPRVNQTAIKSRMAKNWAMSEPYILGHDMGTWLH